MLFGELANTPTGHTSDGRIVIEFRKLISNYINTATHPVTNTAIYLAAR